MRKYGIDLAQRRLGWRRFRPRWRELDLCALYESYYGVDVCFGLGQDPEGVALPSGMEPLAPGPEVDLPFIPGGPPSLGFPCPANLVGMPWSTVEGFDIINLINAGCTIPDIGGPTRLCALDLGGAVQITAIRHPLPEVVQTKTCVFFGDIGQATSAAALGQMSGTF